MSSDSKNTTAPGESAAPKNFIRTIIDRDLAEGRHPTIVTRFPPEPNGFLHIGHAKSICLNFGLARDYDGACHLRFDDTNPEKEEDFYARAIQDDVRWLGFDWGETVYHASDYFEQLYGFAVELIEKGLAYVDSQSPDEIRAQRGTLTEIGQNGPYRDRPVQENLDLFARMRAGEFEEGQCVLRARIDMASPQIILRDPVLYRIRKVAHQRTGDTWCIYPMYDFTHCLSDALEGITHSICTLEFQDNRALYDWVLDNVPSAPCHPQQLEFARLNINYTVTSKRKLLQLVEEGFVSGWDDPRMPTIQGMRRRGFPAAAIRNFCTQIGVSKKDSCVDMGFLESCVRDELNDSAPRCFAVLDPLKVVIENYPEDLVEEFELANHPKIPEMGTRTVSFSRELYIERNDFLEDAPKKFFRLAPGREVRLRGAYFVTCTDVIKDDAGKIIELRCTYDPQTRGGDAPDGRKVKGTMHWLSAKHAIEAEVRLYDRLFTEENPTGDKERDFKEFINPNSLTILPDARVEAGLAEAEAEQCFQFERQGYFSRDREQSETGKPVFNRTVTLRDSWAKKK
ncbi:MAG TPA: glutamine--tRNA ligase/YqeY domain fusion protein [Desulfomicrobiaceae bacterium]|nr:glutamine--tRNA ligase/YqeY domain fusion protein [Desulfomicrobiaceae bacterium]